MNCIFDDMKSRNRKKNLFFVLFPLFVFFCLSMREPYDLDTREIEKLRLPISEKEETAYREMIQNRYPDFFKNP